MKNYNPPIWSGIPPVALYIDVIREGVVIEQHKLEGRDHFLIGSLDGSIDILYKNPLVSRFHAAIQFNEQGESFIVDLGSTHGSWKGDQKLNPHQFVRIQSGDRITFGSQTAKRSFIVREASESAYPPDVQRSPNSSPILSEVASEINRPSLFDSSGQLNTSARRAILVQQREEEREDEITWGFKDEDVPVSIVALSFRKYLNSSTGYLDTVKLKDAEDFSSLTVTQKELLNTIENLQNHQKPSKKKKLKRETDNNEDEDKDTSKKTTSSHDKIGEELGDLINNFFESFDEITSPNLLSEAVGNDHPNTKEALDNRLFDEEDDFFDRSEKAKVPNPFQSRQKMNDYLTTLKEELLSIKSQLSAESDLIAQLDKQQLENDEDDELDRYMKQNERALESSKISSLKKQEEELLSRIKSVEDELQGRISTSQEVPKSHLHSNKAIKTAAAIVAEIAQSHAKKKHIRR